MGATKAQRDYWSMAQGAYWRSLDTPTARSPLPPTATGSRAAQRLVKNSVRYLSESDSDGKYFGVKLAASCSALPSSL